MERIFIGDKNIGVYVTACLTALQKSNEIHISARGRHIKKAVDVEEIVRRYNPEAKVEVKLSSEEFNDRHVSLIDIIMRIE